MNHLGSRKRKRGYQKNLHSFHGRREQARKERARDEEGCISSFLGPEVHGHSAMSPHWALQSTTFLAERKRSWDSLNDAQREPKTKPSHSSRRTAFHFAEDLVTQLPPGRSGECLSQDLRLGPVLFQLKVHWPGIPQGHHPRQGQR